MGNWDGLRVLLVSVDRYELALSLPPSPSGVGGGGGDRHQCHGLWLQTLWQRVRHLRHRTVRMAELVKRLDWGFCLRRSRVLLKCPVLTLDSPTRLLGMFRLTSKYEVKICLKQS